LWNSGNILAQTRPFAGSFPVQRQFDAAIMDTAAFLCGFLLFGFIFILPITVAV
jgi:hypothetical protein